MSTGPPAITADYPLMPDPSIEEPPMDKIVLDDVIDDVNIALARMRALHGTQVFDSNRSTRENALITREMLYIAHLLDMARVQVLDEYHAYRRSGDRRPQRERRR